MSPPRASFYGLAICFLTGLCNLIAEPASDQDSIQELENWDGKPLEEVFKTYTTKPILDEKYPASEAAGEFRTPVHAAYPINDPNSKTVIIMEYWWKDGDYIVSFFFHRKDGIWKVLDAVRWQKNVVF
jgi:hypothetical protein